MVSKTQEIRQAIESLSLSGRPVCIHSSLRSFGHVEGGAETVVQAFLDLGCTVLVPTFSWSFAVPPLLGLRPKRNGWNYEVFAGPKEGIGRIYATDTDEIDRDMGAIPAFVVRQPGRVRGDHPLCSFSALGPLSRSLISDQTVGRVYAPLQALVGHRGIVILMGVELTSMTLLHLAEQCAGRVMFRRWANDRQGNPTMVDVGGCSEGFHKFKDVLKPMMRSVTVGRSEWQAFLADRALSVAVQAIRTNPWLTHCDDSRCDRCNDAVEGGAMFE